MVIGTELGAYLIATELYRDAGEEDRADTSLLQAERDAEELEGFPGLPMSYVMRWYYLNLTRQEEAAYEVARKGYQEAESVRTRRIYVWSLYEQGEFEKALEVVERVRGATELSSRDAKLAGGVHWMRPFIVAEMADGPSRALQAYRDNSALYLEGYNAILNQATLLLLGKREEAMAASRELHDHPERLAGLAREHFLRILKYCGGRISEEELLKAERAPASTSRRLWLRECSGM
jgi:hypothetical protein